MKMAAHGLSGNHSLFFYANTSYNPSGWNIDVHYYLAPGGGCEVLFSPGLSVCVSVCLCMCVSVCPANILVFYLYRILIWLYLIY